MSSFYRKQSIFFYLSASGAKGKVTKSQFLDQRFITSMHSEKLIFNLMSKGENNGK
jgi:hypothetical protein